MKKTAHWLLFYLYLASYFLLIAFSVSIFYVFQPFQFVDNSKSSLACKNNNRYFIGPNLVYSFDGKIDAYNDKKARKVCEYGLIRDYKDEYKAPSSVNYIFNPVYSQESSWSNAAFAFFLAFSLGIVFIEVVFKSVSLLPLLKKHMIHFTLLIFLSVLLGGLLFNFLLKKPTTQIYCKKKVNAMTLNFKLSINFTAQSEEDQYVNNLMKKLYQECLLNEL